MINALTVRLNDIVGNSKSIHDLTSADLPLTPTDEIGFWNIATGKMVKTTISELIQGGSSFADGLFEIFNTGSPTKKLKFNVANVPTTQNVTVTIRNTSGTMAYIADIPGVTHYKDPLQSTANLAAIITENIDDKERRYVEDEVSDYFYDTAAVSGDIAPVDQVGGVGWWKKAYTGVGNVGDMTKVEFMEVSGQVKDSLRLNGELAAFYATAQDLVDAEQDIATNASVINDNALAITLKEDALGNPDAAGYVLSSDLAGNRSWIPVASGGLITFIDTFVATAGQTSKTVPQASIADNGLWTVQVGTEFWNSTTGVTAFVGALLTINFATGVITFNSPLQAGVQVIIKHN